MLKFSLNVVAASYVTMQRPPGRYSRTSKGLAIEGRETSEHLALEKMKSKSPITVVRWIKEEKLLWVIPRCMNNEKKLSKGHVS
jgi:hypothetical protein